MRMFELACKSTGHMSCLTSIRLWYTEVKSSTLPHQWILLSHFVWSFDLYLGRPSYHQINYLIPASPPLISSIMSHFIQSFGNQSLDAASLSNDHSATDWEAQRLIFTQLYITEDRSLPEVRSIMETNHDFKAS